MATGIVQKWDNERGWGFVLPDGGHANLFVHYLNIRGDGFKSLAVGELVEFELAHDERGRPKAVNVRKFL